MTFAITPASGFPPQASDEFPNYLQWRQDGVNLGAPNIDTVDLVGDVSATRGTGENANVLTIAVASNPSGGGAPTAAPPTWRAVTTDDTLTAADIDNGIKVTSGLEGITITVPGDGALALSDPTLAYSVVIEANSTATVSVAAEIGVTVNRRAAFAAQLAGQYSVATLIRVSADTWVLCGDLAAA